MIRTALLAITLSLTVAACGDDGGESGIDCTQSTLTYANFGESFIEDYCLECHSSTAENRMGAPGAINFDSFDDIVNHKTRIDKRAGEGTTMPPRTYSSTPSDLERESLVEWLECGPAQ